MDVKPISGHSISHVSEDDFPALVEFFLASKLALSVNRFLWTDWPNETAQRAQYRSTLESSQARDDINSYKVTHDGTGEIVAHLATSHLKGNNKATDIQPVPKTPDGVNAAVFRAVISTIGKVNAGVAMVDRIELTWIYVRPTSRRHQIGRRLVQLAREEALSKHLPLVAVSEPQAHGFFTSAGFDDQAHAEIDVAQWAPPFSGYGSFRLYQMVDKQSRGLEEV